MVVVMAVVMATVMVGIYDDCFIMMRVTKMFMMIAA